MAIPREYAMATERVTIVDLEPDTLHVSAGDRDHCGRCSARSGCGQHLLQTWFDRPSLTLALPRPALAGAEHLRAGDALTLSLDDRSIAAYSLLLYLVPLAAMLLATAAASTAGLAEAWVVLSALSALAAGLAGIRKLGSAPGHHLHSMLDIVVPATVMPARTDQDP